MHQQEPVLLKASRTLFWREAQSFDGAGNIIREQRQLEPSSIDCKVLAGHVSAGQSVFDFIMHMLHGAGFFPVPVKQPGCVPVQIGQHGMMMPVAAIIEETPWGLSRRSPT